MLVQDLCDICNIFIAYTDLRRHSTVELWLMCLNVNPLCWFSLPCNL